jgi:hypothetical protein
VSKEDDLKVSLKKSDEKTSKVVEAETEKLPAKIEKPVEPVAVVVPPR